MWFLEGIDGVFSLSTVCVYERDNIITCKFEQTLIENSVLVIQRGGLLFFQTNSKNVQNRYLLNDLICTQLQTT